jgi:hypothetical protein
MRHVRATLAISMLWGVFCGCPLYLTGCGGQEPAPEGTVEELPPDKQAEIEAADAYYDSQAKPKKRAR